MELFFEIHSEEIPAMMQLDAQNFLKDLLVKFLDGIDYTTIETYITPQRLVGHIDGLSATTKETVELVRGPKTNAQEDIITRFCAARQTSRESLIEQGDYFHFEKTTPAKSIKDLIPSMLEFIFDNFSWPKVMRWPQSEMKWVRPIRSIMVIFNGQSIILELPRLGLTSKSYTTGHRFLAPTSITPKTFEEYKHLLKEHYVILDHQERQNIIEATLQGALKDEDLIVENAGLAEWPIVKKGNIAQEFMSLPQAVLKTVMKKHQKYFFFPDQAHFSVVCNTENDNSMKGYERVLRARLNDARFFYNEDMKIPLASYDLSKIVFYKDLGTFQDKINRLLTLAKTENEKQVIRLCKQDLMTQMVGEFPELQGAMGSIYAKAQGFSDAIAEAVKDHIRLQPQTNLGAQVSLLDHLDSLVGLLGAGVKVSGSKDPFGLRRHALTIIRIYEKFENLGDISNLIDSILEQYQTLPKTTKVLVMNFIHSRFKVYYQEDELYIQLALKTCQFHELRIASLHLKEFLQSEDGIVFLQSFKRLIGLVKIKELSLTPIQTNHPSEQILDEVVRNNITKDDLALIGRRLHQFFNDVTVNEGSPELIASRQNLLFLVKQKIEALGDFSLAL